MSLAHNAENFNGGSAWRNRAPELARWAMDRVVMRTDRHGGYYRKTNPGTGTAVTRKAAYPPKGPQDGAVTLALVERHFRATTTGELIGFYPVAPGNTGKWLGIDIDAHTEADDPEKNLRYALHLYVKLHALGFRPLLYASNNKGGYHLLALLAEAVESQTLFAFGRWLVAGHRAHGFDAPPEVFPKQPTLTEDRPFGNWLRLVGRHHTEDFWPRVFDGTDWREGEAAVKHVLSLTGDSPSLIPFDVMVAAAEPAGERRPGRSGRSTRKSRPAVGADTDLQPDAPVWALGRWWLVTPWDDYDRKATRETFYELLAPRNWTVTSDGDGEAEVARPGREGGRSAVIGGVCKGQRGELLLHCFTPDAHPLAERGTYGASRLRALLAHGGTTEDAYKACGLELAKLGYGQAGGGIRIGKNNTDASASERQDAAGDQAAEGAAAATPDAPPGPATDTPGEPVAGEPVEPCDDSTTAEDPTGEGEAAAEGDDEAAGETDPGGTKAKRDFGAAVFSDPDELRRLAELKLDDPAAFALEKARLKARGASVRDLDKAIEKYVRETAEERMAHADPSELAKPPTYFAADGCIYRNAPTREGGYAETPLCNFAAHITADVTTDDGAEQKRSMRVAGRLASGDPLPEADVAADEFARMEWVIGKWGSGAVVYAGASTRDHLRAAIQVLSPDVPRETVYAHLGWRDIDGVPAYLHAGGAIGPGGSLSGVRVSVPAQLAGYSLPDPPTGERRRKAVRASLGLVLEPGLAPDSVMIPLVTAPYRAALGGADYTIGVYGRRGYGKTELAALAQQHHGPALNARALPGSWSSTANALEALAFAAKDAVFTIDDYCPDGADPAKLRQLADRVLRGQGNHSGRARLGADASHKPAKPPRCLTLVTGEDVPGGASARARQIVTELSGSLELGPGNRLGRHQKEAASGVYAEALAAFVCWLAGDLSGRWERFKADAARLRDELAGVGGHNRIPAAAGDLLAAFDVLLAFGREVGAATPAEAESLRSRARAAVSELAVAQEEHQRDADLAERFPVLVRSALTSGRAHLADRTGERPDEAWSVAAGWRRLDVGSGGWAAPGQRIGWLAGDQVFLDPEAALAVVRRLADDQGGAFTITPRTIWKRLHEARKLVEVDHRGNVLRYTVRRVVEGTQHDVLVFATEGLLPRASVQSGHSGEKHRENDPIGLASHDESARPREWPVATGLAGGAGGVRLAGEGRGGARPDAGKTCDELAKLATRPGKGEGVTSKQSHAISGHTEEGEL